MQNHDGHLRNHFIALPLGQYPTNWPQTFSPLLPTSIGTLRYPGIRVYAIGSIATALTLHGASTERIRQLATPIIDYEAATWPYDLPPAAYATRINTLRKNNVRATIGWVLYTLFHYILIILLTI